MKCKFIAVFFALLFSGSGAHNFYLGRVNQGWLYNIFSWTLIPFVLTISEAIYILLFVSKEKFDKKYNTRILGLKSIVPAGSFDFDRMRKRGLAIIFTWYFGTLGVHKFYFGDTKAGSVYISIFIVIIALGSIVSTSMFALLLVVMLVNLIGAIRLSRLSDDEFDAKYNPGLVVLLSSSKSEQ